MKRQSSLLLLTLATMVALAILLGLGFWQLQRKSWKDSLIRQVAARMNTPAGPLPARAAWPILARPEAEFTRLTVEGTLLNDREVYLYRSVPQGATGAPYGPGWDVITPLKTQDGGIILVNRGFVPHDRKQLDARPPAPLQVRLNGLVRHSEGRGMFAAVDEPAKRQFYTRDIAVFSAAMGFAPGETAPFMMDADHSPEATLPRPGLHRLNLPNRHFEYALTWFGLAGTLVGVYLFFMRGQLRRQRLETGGELV